jgi:hypothetical protein
MPAVLFTGFLTLCTGLKVSGAAFPAAGGGKMAVEIRQEGGSYRLYRGGQPYYIKGVGGRRFIETAAAAGANSVRTWGSQNAGSILDRAQSCGMTAMIGIWLSHAPLDYFRADYKNAKIAEVRDLLERYKNHPALLMWSLGNEINLEGADIAEAWRFVNRLALLIKAEDPNHPVITVISSNGSTLNNIADYAPDLDAIGINAYGALEAVRSLIEASAYAGPYLITEWGTNGHWEVEHTFWGRPLEPASAVKAEDYCRRYRQAILANRDRCLGSYVFLWGQKQERTPTWYSMFIRDVPGVEAGAASCPTVDVMGYSWSGSWPSNRAPEVTAITINGFTADDDITLTLGEAMIAEVAARDPDEDRLTYVWELLEEPVELGSGGSPEPRPQRIGNIAQGTRPLLSIFAPQTAGAYRLFVYVFDGNGHVGTANAPFWIDSERAPADAANPS